MDRRLLLVVVVGLTVDPSVCRASDEVRPAPEPTLSVDLFVGREVSASREYVTVNVSAHTQESKGIVRIRVPSTLEVVAGDTLFSVPPRRALPPVSLTLRPRASGAHTIRATLTAGPPNGDHYLVETALPLAVSGDSIAVGVRQSVRNECVLGGVRYRYGGFWLVPLEADEDVAVGDFNQFGTKPRLLGGLRARCSGCRSAVDTVRFVVVVNRSGRVIQTRALTPLRHDPGAVAAAREAVARADSNPGSTGGT